jgi:hypothetical protein
MSYFIDPLHSCIAIVPLAVYLFVLGALNLSSRPRCISGVADSFLLGAGLAGFVVIGPLQLFLPSATAFRMGMWVWPLLLTAYLLCLTLYVLLSRPRIVIYNMNAQQLRPLLAEVFSELDSEVRWAGDSASLSRLGVQLHVETTAPFRNAQLIATSSEQNYEAWGQLQKKLARRLLAESGTRNPSGAAFLLTGLLLLAASALWAVSDPEMVAQSFHELIHPGD